MIILKKENNVRRPAPAQWRPWVTIAVLAALTGACTKSELSYLKRTATVATKDLQQIVTVAGKVQPFKLSQVIAPYSGYIRQIYVKVGQDVKKGDPLLSITTNLDQGSGVFPLRSPFAGRITQINVVEGQYVEEKAREGATLIRLEDLSKFFLDVEVTELDMPKITLGQSAKVRIASLPGRDFGAQVEEISLAPKEVEGRRSWGQDTQSRYRVKLAMSSRSDDFRSGMSATVDIQTAERKKALALPGEFLTATEGQDAVKLKDGSLRKIKVGLRTDEEFEVVEGLKTGDEVMMDDLTAYAR